MKRARASFGHSEKDYRLANIFRRSTGEFDVVDRECQRLEKAFAVNKTVSIGLKLASVAQQRTEAGVVAIMTAVACIEYVMYSYAVHHLDQDSYDEHLGNLRLLTRCLLLPRLCQNKVIEEEHPAINNLRELIAARNVIVHPKMHVMGDDPFRAVTRSKKEGVRFLAACRKLGKTMAGLNELLDSPWAWLLTVNRAALMAFIGYGRVSPPANDLRNFCSAQSGHNSASNS